MTAEAREAGMAALEAGDLAAAVAAFERAIAGGDHDPDLAVMRAAALGELGQVSQARAAVRELLRHHVGHEAALALLEQLEAIGGAAPPATPAEGWQVGAVVHDRWEVFGSAAGGMGRVWFVRDRAWDGMELAVKSLLVASSDPAHVERARRLFRRESQVWLDLGGHPNIVSGFYTIELDDALRFFMEYVSGRSLAQWLHADRRLPLAAALDQAIQLASGLEYVHARGMVHRDVKPANCLVMSDGTLRITDFGLGKTERAGDERIAPAPGISDRVRGDMSIASAGTPAYMAPEQWRSLGEAGAPADIYAIGVTLFELLAGELPFGVERGAWSRYEHRAPAAVQAVLRAESPIPALVIRMLHDHVVPVRLRELGIDVPDDVEDVIAACLAKSPAARPDAGALRAALVACHERHAGAYPRELPSSLAPTQIGENNRAVSYFVMGELATARAILDGVLAADATALFPWINRAQLALAAGTLEPTTAAEQLATFVLTAHPGMADDRDVVAFRDQVAHSYLAHDAPLIAVDTRDAAVATLSAVGTVSVWDDTGVRRVAELPDATGLAYLANGLAIACGPNVIVFDDAGRCHHIGAPAHVTALAARGDGSVLVGGDGDGGVTVWATAAGTSRVLRGVRGLVRTVAVCPTTDLVAAGGVEGGFAVHEAGRAGAPLFTDPNGCLACHVNGAWGVAVAGGSDGTIRVWELASRQLLATMVGHTRAVTGLAFASDGRLLSTSADGTLRAWDARRGQELRAWRIHHGPIRGLALAHGDVAVTAGEDQAARRTTLGPWPEQPRLVVRKDVSALERKRRLAERDEVIAQIAAGDATALAKAAALRRRAPELARDDRLREAEHAGGASLGIPVGVTTAYTRWSRRLPWPATRLALHPSGGGLAVAGDLGEDSELQLWDIAGVPRATVRMPRIVALVWARDGVALYVASIDNKVRRLAAPALVVEWTGDWAGTGGIRALACGARELVGGGWSRSVLRSSLQANGTLRTWRDRPASAELERRGDEVVALAATSDGTRIASARDHGKIAIWELATRKRAGRELEHPGEVVALAFSADGRRLFAANRDGGWACWLPNTASPPITARHPGGVTTARPWSGDRHLVTAGGDGTVRVWDVAQGRELGVLRGHSGAVLVDVHPERHELATAGDDRVLHLWSIELEWLLGEPALADAFVAVANQPSRAWGPPSPSARDRALDVWRDVARAPRLAAGWPAQWQQLHAHVRALTG